MNILRTAADWPIYTAGLIAQYGLTGDLPKAPQPKEYPCLAASTVAGGVLVTDFVYLTDAWILLGAFGEQWQQAQLRPDEVATGQRLDPCMVTAQLWAVIHILLTNQLTTIEGFESVYTNKRRLLDETLTAQREKSPLPTTEHQEAYRFLQRLGVLAE